MHKNTGLCFDFSIIADIDMSVSKLYGMLQPNKSATAAVRAVFFFDPTQTIRLIMYYPLNVDRNMDEILRALTALQVADNHKGALPLSWTMGDEVIIPPPKALDEMAYRIADKTCEEVDFFLASKAI